MGLLDGLAYGLAGGLRGGAEAAQPALSELQHGALQSELNQQTSDLRVAADKQVLDYSTQKQQDVAAQTRARQAGYAAPNEDGTPATLAQIGERAMAAGDFAGGESAYTTQNKAERTIGWGAVALDEKGKELYNNSQGRQMAAMTGKQKNLTPQEEMQEQLKTRALVRASVDNELGGKGISQVTDPMTKVTTNEPVSEAVHEVAYAHASDNFGSAGAESPHAAARYAQGLQQQAMQAAVKANISPESRPAYVAEQLQHAVATRPWANPPKSRVVGPASPLAGAPPAPPAATPAPPAAPSDPDTTPLGYGANTGHPVSDTMNAILGR
jgi:hypothetical protein